MFQYKAQAEQCKADLEKSLQQNSWDQSEIKDLKVKVELLQAELQASKVQLLHKTEQEKVSAEKADKLQKLYEDERQANDKLNAFKTGLLASIEKFKQT